jgi:hypothetical protein
MCSKINHRYDMGVDINKELDDDNLCILVPEQEIQKLLSRFYKGQSRPGDQHYIKLLTKKVTGQITWPGDINIKSNFFSSQLQWIEFSNQPKKLQLSIKHFLLAMPIFQCTNNRQHCSWLQNKLAVYMQKKRAPKKAISDSYYRESAAVPFGHPDGLAPPPHGSGDI